MGKIKTIARRSFLIGSLAVAGGVAFGVYKYKTPHENPLLKDLSEGQASITPWVKITSSGITIITPHTDKGQGSASLQAMLIAEELDLDFGQFDIDFGEPSPAYYNTAMGAEAAPFLSSDTSWTAETMRGVMGGMIKLLGMQLTGGSSTVPDGFEKLRVAGAVARETLKAAASKKSGVAVSKLKTEKGHVLLPNGEKLAYTDLASIGASIEPVQEVKLRDPKDWRLIGQNVTRLDMLAKSTGTQSYGIDSSMDGMVHATVKTNPRRGGIKFFNASSASKMRGFKKALKVTNGFAVIADNTWRAFQIADAMEVEWEPAPYPAEQEQHWEAVEKSFTDEHLDKEWRTIGDVDQAIANGSEISSEYKAPYVAHQPLEPLNALIKVTDERVDIWVAHQIPRVAEDKIAEITGHDVENVHLHALFAGGSFGHRLEFQNITLAAEIGNQMRGKPVKLTYKREEDFAQDFNRQIGMSRARGTVKNGQVEAFDLSIATVSSSRSQSKRLGASIPGPDSQIVSGAWNMPFGNMPNLRVRGYAVPELAPTSSWRSVGAVTAGFFGECSLDELIHAAGADPLEERLRLCDNPLARKTLEAVGQMSGWNGAKIGANRGRGIALVESFGVHTAEVVEVTNTDDGIKIDKIYVAAEVGRVIDPVNFENQVQGGVVWALGHAMNCEITFSDGMVEQENYYAHEGMRLHQCPEIIVKGLENGDHVRGMGEPMVPPAAPALANAIFAATGQRIREMPFNKHIDFV